METRRTISIRKESESLETFTIEENAPSNTATLLLQDLEGWEAVQMDIETVPKLFGNGSFITQRKVAETELVLGFWIDNDPMATPRFILDYFTGAAISGETVVISRRLHDPVRTIESLNGVVRSIEDYRQISDTSGFISVTFLVTDPIKITTPF